MALFQLVTCSALIWKKSTSGICVWAKVLFTYFDGGFHEVQRNVGHISPDIGTLYAVTMSVRNHLWTDPIYQPPSQGRASAYQRLMAAPQKQNVFIFPRLPGL